MDRPDDHAQAPECPSRTPLEVFERIYQAHQDPWRCESNWRERAKYARTIGVLGARRYRRALEVGSGIGVLTHELSRRCDAVVALEPSTTALSRAALRLRGSPNVEFVQGALPGGLPAGPFDLVVCSEVLYYLNERLLNQSLGEIERRLAAGGTLITVHYAPSRCSRLLSRVRRRGSPHPPAPLSGERVHELLRKHTRLGQSIHERHSTYLLDRFDDCA